MNQTLVAELIRTLEEPLRTGFANKLCLAQMKNPGLFKPTLFLAECGVRQENF